MLVPAALTGACQAVAPLGRCLVGGLENDRNTFSIPILVCLPQKYEMIPRCPADIKIERRKSMRHPSTENHVRFLLQRSERQRVIARDKYLNPASCRSCMPRTGSSPHPLTNRSIYGRTSHRASHDQAARPDPSGRPLSQAWADTPWAGCDAGHPTACIITTQPPPTSHSEPHQPSSPQPHILCSPFFSYQTTIKHQLQY